MHFQTLGQCPLSTQSRGVGFRPIADIRIVRHNREMSFPRSTAVLLVLAACQQAQRTPDQRENAAPRSTTIPFSKANVNDAAYHLRVGRDGTFSWNGQVVNEPTLRDYLEKFSGLPSGAGSLSLEFEPGTPTTTVELVRRQVTDSGLCRQNRCLEMQWGTETRVVN